MNCECLYGEIEKCKEIKIGGCTMSHFVGVTLSHSHFVVLDGATAPSIVDGCTCSYGFTGTTMACNCPAPIILYDELTETVKKIEEQKKLFEITNEKKRIAREQLSLQKDSCDKELEKVLKHYELVKDKEELPELKKFLEDKKSNLENQLTMLVKQIEYFN